MRTMATSTWNNIILPTDPEPKGIFQVLPLTSESAGKTAELLSKNHELYHIFIHNAGVHSKLLFSETDGGSYSAC